MHENNVEFMVYGRYGLFSDPITKVGGEKCSCQIPSYEAIKGVLHSIYWKPTIIWIVDQVRVMNQIQMETKGIRPIKMSGGNDLAYYTYLKDCCYQVKAHFVWNENRPELSLDWNENKHHNIAKRSIQKGGRRDVFLGTRECQAYVEPYRFGEGKGYYDAEGESSRMIAFGMSYHGITYPDEAYSEETKGKMSIRFWQATMTNGIITYPPPASFPTPEEGVKEGKAVRAVKELTMKRFGYAEENFVGLKEFDFEEGANGLDTEMS